MTMIADDHRAAWMHTGAYGLMVHWLMPGIAPETEPGLSDFDSAVERFDRERFLADFAVTGADWLILTLGQNTGTYISPNATLERLAGPGYCAQRDLAREIAQGVVGLGKRFIAYLPSEVSHQSVAVQEAFGWRADDPTQALFQQRYCAFVRDYSLAFGPLLSGWWFDGCFLPLSLFPPRLFDWPTWAGAARAGNPDAALAFNDGSLCVGVSVPISPIQDYLAGEVEVLHAGKIRFGRGTPHQARWLSCFPSSAALRLKPRQPSYTAR